jgi:hypothetical protein
MAQKIQGFPLGLVHFPVASNNNFSHGVLRLEARYTDLYPCIVLRKEPPNQILQRATFDSGDRGWERWGKGDEENKERTLDLPYPPHRPHLSIF